MKNHSYLGCIGLIVVLLILLSADQVASARFRSPFPCTAAPSHDPICCASARCLPEAAQTANERPPLLRVQAPSATNLGKWRLVRTPGPDKGAEIVSIMHTADLLRSDPDFAGLVIRCRQKVGLEVGFVVVRPFPPRARPAVRIGSGQSSVQLQATVLPSGTTLDLPQEATALLRGPWQTAKELTVAIDGDGSAIKGVVPLEKLASALALLQANCPRE